MFFIYQHYYNWILVAAGKKADPKAAAKKVEQKPAVKKWTKEDDAARKIQTVARGFLSRRTLQKMRKEKEDYEALMDKLEQEVYHCHPTFNVVLVIIRLEL